MVAHNAEFDTAFLAAECRRLGFEVEAMYGWFDLRPYEGGEDTLWIARRPAV